jgi:hypothetical protein
MGKGMLFIELDLLFDKLECIFLVSKSKKDEPRMAQNIILTPQKPCRSEPKTPFHRTFILKATFMKNDYIVRLFILKVSDTPSACGGASDW